MHRRHGNLTHTYCVSCPPTIHPGAYLHAYQHTSKPPRPPESLSSAPLTRALFSPQHRLNGLLCRRVGGLLFFFSFSLSPQNKAPAFSSYQPPSIAGDRPPDHMMDIPPNVVGWVIGKNGTRINEIQQRTHAAVSEEASNLSCLFCLFFFHFLSLQCWCVVWFLFRRLICLLCSFCRISRTSHSWCVCAWRHVPDEIIQNMRSPSKTNQN